MKDVGIDEHLGAQIPLDLRFRDENGAEVTLASLFPGDRPAVLSLNYSDCPMLCTLVLNGLVDGLEEMPWTPGREFDVISVSIDPLETPQRARLTKQKYLRNYGRPETAGGWHFLTGTQENIKRLADAVGFRYKYVEKDKQYVHAAVIMICTPQGRMSRYLYGVQFPEQTLRLSLVEAGEGKVGSTMDKVLLFCFHYDAEAGRYGPVARNLMKLGAGMTCTLVLLALIPVLAAPAEPRATAFNPKPPLSRRRTRRAEPGRWPDSPCRWAVCSAPGRFAVLPAASLDRCGLGRRDLLLHLHHLGGLLHLDRRPDGGVRVQVPPPRGRGTGAQRQPQHEPGDALDDHPHDPGRGDVHLGILGLHGDAAGAGQQLRDPGHGQEVGLELRLSQRPHRQRPACPDGSADPAGDDVRTM